LNGQNHIFALVKETNEKLHLYQGYIANHAAGSPGYDLSEWLKSGNKMAKPINKQALLKDNDFLFKILEKFISDTSDSEGNPRNFDGANFAKAFLSDESSFNRQPYTAMFTWSEVTDECLVERAKKNGDFWTRLSTRKGKQVASAVSDLATDWKDEPLIDV
jgi:hypothetical protein